MKRIITILLVLLTVFAFTACGKDEDKTKEKTESVVTGEAGGDITSEASPTATPTIEPTVTQTAEPTTEPTVTQSAEPTAAPTGEAVPTKSPVSGQDAIAVLDMGDADEQYNVTYDSEVLEVLDEGAIEGLLCFLATDGSETEIDITVYPDSDAQGLYDAWLLVLGDENYSGMLGGEATASLLGSEAKMFQFVTGYEEEFGYYNYEYFVDVEGVGAVGCSLYYFEETEFTQQEILDAIKSIKYIK